MVQLVNKHTLPLPFKSPDMTDMPYRCVYLSFKAYMGSFFSVSSAKRTPFSAAAGTQPLRILVPSSHADVSSRLQPHASARDEESGDHHEAKLEGYATARI